MINSNFKIQKRPQISFNGRSNSEWVKIGKSAKKILIHETALFREPQTNEFVKKLIQETFSNNDTIKIVSAGCSSGEECMTYSMMFDDLPQKIEILGFDLSKHSIQEANSRIILMQKIIPQTEFFKKIFPQFEDAYLAFEQEKPLTPEQKKYKQLFNDFFELLNFPSKKIKLKEKLQKWISKKLDPIQHEDRYFMLKENKAQNCRFIQGDVMDIEKFTGEHNVNVLSIKNMLYHILSTNPECQTCRNLKPNAAEIFKDLIYKFKNILTDKGIIILGEQEDMQVTGFSEIVPKLLEKSGFRPRNQIDNHYANVWQKI